VGGAVQVSATLVSCRPTRRESVNGFPDSFNRVANCCALSPGPLENAEFAACPTIATKYDIVRHAYPVA